MRAFFEWLEHRAPVWVVFPVLMLFVALAAPLIIKAIALYFKWVLE